MAQPTEVATLVAASEPTDRDEESSELIHNSGERVEPPATVLEDTTIGLSKEWLVKGQHKSQLQMTYGYQAVFSHEKMGDQRVKKQL